MILAIWEEIGGWERVEGQGSGGLEWVAMKPLDEEERADLLARINDAHGQVTAAVSDLRRRYAAKAAVVKAAVKAERYLFTLRREMEKLEDGEAPARPSLPEVRRGGKAVDLGQLGSRGPRSGRS
jgi:hypothetical protein